MPTIAVTGKRSEHELDNTSRAADQRQKIFILVVGAIGTIMKNLLKLFCLSLLFGFFSFFKNPIDHFNQKLSCERLGDIIIDTVSLG